MNESELNAGGLESEVLCESLSSFIFIAFYRWVRISLAVS